MDIETRHENEVGVVEINRSERMNALTVDVATGIGTLAERLVRDGARALVLTGRGGTFCAGADLNLVEKAFEGKPEEALSPLVAELHATIRKLRSLPVPVVAAIEGPAVGAGLGLALAADIRIAAEGAQLVPGYLSIGSSPDGGVSYFLGRMLGPAVATRILLRNEALSVDSARTLGLVDERADEGAACQVALERAQQLSSTPPLALVRTRVLLDASTTHSLEEHLDQEQRLVTELWETADFHEGVSSFLNRRAPRFRGA